MTSAPTETKTEQPARSNQPLVIARGIGGAVIGGIAGYLAFRWLASQGFYAIMLVGLLIGVGAGLAARQKSVILGVICAAIALPAGILSEWNVMPFVNDKSLSFFLTNLAPLHWLFIALGAAAAFWFGQGR